MDIAQVIDYLKSYDGRQLQLMEVCGTHTAAIFKNGIRDLISPKIKLISGPGCPVCVTPTAFIDKCVSYAKAPGCELLTFGDMMKVPGTAGSLSENKAGDEGGAKANITIMYSPLEAIEKAAPTLASLLSRDGSMEAATAIMTTDTRPKEIAVSFEIGGKEVRLGGIAKGSGMIHPNMGTMLCFLTTDCDISSDVLQSALYSVVKTTFNRVSVDGDTSTNDMCCILASGKAENPIIDWRSEDYDVFCEALKFVCTELAKKIAGDGEGATKLVACTVSGSRSDEAAEKLAMEVIRSSLVKAAMFGADANWGRVICAMGYSKAPFRPEYVDVAFSSAAGTVEVCKAGEGLDFDEDLAKTVLTQPEVEILVNVNEGEHTVTAWGCDLTYDYVKINGDYRT